MVKKAIGNFKRQNFVTGALTLAGAGILCRVIGIGFRIPFANIVGNYGMGLYQMVFPLYALLLILSSAGIPIAISKMVAALPDDGTKAIFTYRYIYKMTWAEVAEAACFSSSQVYRLHKKGIEWLEAKFCSHYTSLTNCT